MGSRLWQWDCVEACVPSNHQPPRLDPAPHSPLLFGLVRAHVHRQCPCAFEYSGDTLGFLAAHLYAGATGTLMHNTDAERDASGVRRSRASLWAMLAARRSEFVQPGYEAGEAGAGPPLPVSSCISRLTLWDALLPPPAEAMPLELGALGWAAAEEGRDEPWALAGGSAGSRDEAEGECWCRLRLSHTTLCADARGAEFTLYHIVTGWPEPDEEGEEASEGAAGTAGGVGGGCSGGARRPDESNEIAHRYSDFAALDAAIREYRPEVVVMLPPLPTSMTINKLSSNVIHQRVGALQVYLDFIAATHSLAHLEHVRKFLLSPPSNLQGMSR